MMHYCNIKIVSFLLIMVNNLLVLRENHSKRLTGKVIFNKKSKVFHVLVILFKLKKVKQDLWYLRAQILITFILYQQVRKRTNNSLENTNKIGNLNKKQNQVPNRLNMTVREKNRNLKYSLLHHVLKKMTLKNNQRFQRKTIAKNNQWSHQRMKKKYYQWFLLKISKVKVHLKKRKLDKVR